MTNSEKAENPIRQTARLDRGRVPKHPGAPSPLRTAASVPRQQTPGMVEPISQKDTTGSNGEIYRRRRRARGEGVRPLAKLILW